MDPVKATPQNGDTMKAAWRAYRSDSDYPEPEWYVEGPDDRTYGPFDEDEALGVRDALNHDKTTVAWRTRDRNVPNQVWTLWNQGWEPTHWELNLRYTYDTSNLDAEVQPLCVHSRP